MVYKNSVTLSFAELLFCKENIRNNHKFWKYDKWILSWMKLSTKNIALKEIFRLTESLLW